MKRLLSISSLLALLLILLAAGTCLAQGKVNLEYKFKPKEELKYTLSMGGVTKTTMSPEMMPPQTMQMKGGMDFLQFTKQVHEDGSALLEMSCPQMSMDMNVAGQNISMLWQKGKMSMLMNGEPQPVDTADFSQIPFLGVPLKIRIDKLGKPLEMPDLAAISKMAGNFDFTQLLSSSQSQLPAVPVGVGDTWSADMEVPLPGSTQMLKTKTIYTLTGFERAGGDLLAKIDMKMTTQAKNLKLNLQGTQGGPDMIIETLKQDGKGSLLFNVDRGDVQKNTMSLKMLEVMAMSTPQGTMRTTIDMDMKVDMKLK